MSLIHSSFEIRVVGSEFSDFYKTVWIWYFSTGLATNFTDYIGCVRKAVRAAVVLLPLLGITNLLNMAEAPLDRSVWEFAIWSYSTHFLTSFQGLIIASLYCFLNGEVSNIVDLISIVFFLQVRMVGSKTQD